MIAAQFSNSSRLVYVKDRISRQYFLVDSGAALSVLPYDGVAAIGRLVAANGSGISTFGTAIRNLALGDLSFVWKFTLAQVKTPILGADFLSHFVLSLDICKLKLTDENANIIQLSRMDLAFKMATIDATKLRFENIARNFKILEPNFQQKHGVTHFIETTMQRPVYDPSVPRGRCSAKRVRRCSARYARSFGG